MTRETDNPFDSLTDDELDEEQESLLAAYSAEGFAWAYEGIDDAVPSGSHGSRISELIQRQYPPTVWADEGLVPEGLTLLAGVPKGGKSWLAMGLAAGWSVVAGEQAEAGGDTLYLALEDSPRRISSRGRAMQAEGVTFPENIYVFTAGEWPRMGDGFMEVLEAWLGEHPSCRLILIDTLAKVLPRGTSGSDYSESSETLAGLHALANSRGIPVVVVHHSRKSSFTKDGSQVRSDPIEEVLGSQAFAGTADTILILSQGGGNAMIRGRGRDLEEDIYLKVERPGTLWRLRGVQEDVDKSTVYRYTVMEVLRQHPDGLGTNQLSAVTKLDKKTLTPMMQGLVESGEVTLTPGPNRSKVYSIKPEDVLA